MAKVGPKGAVLHARMHHIYRNYCGGFRWSVLLQRGVHVVRSVFLRVGKGLDMYVLHILKHHLHQQQLLLKSKGPPSRWIKLIDQQLGEEHHF